MEEKVEVLAVQSVDEQLKLLSEQPKTEEKPLSKELSKR